jgi:hypothetical protein
MFGSVGRISPDNGLRISSRVHSLTPPALIVHSSYGHRVAIHHSALVRDWPFPPSVS